MWFLPSRRRPENLKRFFDYYRETKADSKGVVWVDSDDHDGYLDIELPEGWSFIVHQRMDGTGSITNAFFDKYPNEPWYGLLGDDVIPRTEGWDKKLIAAAGSDGLAYGDDLMNGKTHAAHPVIGGDLVRSLKWLALPGCKRTYIDNALMEVAKRKGKLYYLPEVQMEHMHFSNGKAAMDETYQKEAGDKEIYEAWLKSLDKPITFVCVNWGNYCERGAEYVNNLFDMVYRNLSKHTHFKFVCFTDNADGLDSNIEARALPAGVKGWWNKLYLFKEGLFKDSERIVFLDLDTCITSGLDDIIRYDGEFAILRDFYHPKRYGPGIMLWEAGFGKEIWQRYEDHGYPTDLPLGDLSWINLHFSTTGYSPQILQDLFPNQIGSYKVHASEKIPKGMRIVCFHGQPRPHQCRGWVEHVWKIGGGTVPQLDLQCNTTEDDLIKNIGHSISLNLPKLAKTPPFDGHAIIVGGGPSLKDGIKEIKLRQEHFQVIFATNATYNYLLQHGITADYHVMIDARPENAAFVPKNAQCYYSSQCHPEVFERASANGNKVTLWHHLAYGIQEYIGHDTGEPLVGGGFSVGMKAIAIAYILGYRNFHLYGFDSCYTEESHHAYKQTLNDNENIIEAQVNDRRFKCAAWMLTQAEDFRELMPELVKEGCIITVHGEGLIPYLASTMGQPYQSVANEALQDYNYTNNLYNTPQEVVNA